ncbi:MAG TPA: response regulator transcription factor [Rubrobacteraceae bacterium]|jgi:two-component system response regulator DevR|nr:response regulator transcription factor [Rubrobacteraceae bacterium]
MEQGRKQILRVVVVDGHPVTREGQRAVLSAEGDMQIVGEAGTGEEALRLVTEAAPDLVVLDFNLAGKPNAIDLCRQIKALPAAPYILIFTAYNLAEDVPSRSLREANGYLHKCSDREELLDTVRRVATGEKVWEAGEGSGERGAVIHAALEDARLTRRELEVLAMKLRRRTNAEIANALHISLNTVKHHVTSIYKKLEKSRKDLLRV